MGASSKISSNQIHSSSETNIEKSSKSIDSGSYNDNFIAGAFAGFIARLITAPFDFMKIRIQLQSPEKSTSLLHTFRTVVKEEGFFALWGGNIAATYLWISYAMVQFSMYSFMKKTLEEMVFPPTEMSLSKPHKQNIESTDKTTKNSHSSSKKAVILFMSGAIAGIAATITTYPFDVMRTQFVLQNKVKTFPTQISFIRHTYATKGFHGFYPGIAPAVVGITPYMGLNFALYESIKTIASGPLQKLRSHDNPIFSSIGNILGNSLCGGAAGALSKIAMYPLDTIKKRLQAQGLNSMTPGMSKLPQYKGMVHCATTIWKQEGIKGLYRGIVPTTVKSLASTAVTFAAFEAAKDFLDWRRSMKGKQSNVASQKSKIKS